MQEMRAEEETAGGSAVLVVRVPTGEIRDGSVFGSRTQKKASAQVL